MALSLTRPLALHPFGYTRGRGSRLGKVGSERAGVLPPATLQVYCLASDGVCRVAKNLGHLTVHEARAHEQAGHALSRNLYDNLVTRV